MATLFNYKMADVQVTYLNHILALLPYESVYLPLYVSLVYLPLFQNNVTWSLSISNVAQFCSCDQIDRVATENFITLRFHATRCMDLSVDILQTSCDNTMSTTECFRATLNDLIGFKHTKTSTQLTQMCKHACTHIHRSVYTHTANYHHIHNFKITKI